MEVTSNLLEYVLSGIPPKFTPPLSHDDAVSQSRLLKALSDPTRLRLLSLLSQYGGQMTVQEITDCFKLEQPTVSHHIKILREAGLVDCHKKGVWAYYYVRMKALEQARNIIEDLA